MNQSIQEFCAKIYGRKLKGGLKYYWLVFSCIYWISYLMLWKNVPLGMQYFFLSCLFYWLLSWICSSFNLDFSLLFLVERAWNGFKDFSAHWIKVPPPPLAFEGKNEEEHKAASMEFSNWIWIYFFKQLEPENSFAMSCETRRFLFFSKKI